jgi:hypothetical protein
MMRKEIWSLLLAVGLLAFPRFSLAAPLPRLVVTRSAEAADCPDAAVLAFVVEKQMQRPALDPSADASAAASYEVTIDRLPDRYAATIRSGELTRELSDPGSTCAELADALALMLTIMLDSEPAVLPAKPPESAPVPSSKPLAPPPPIEIRVILQTVRQWSAGLSGTLGESIGFLSPLSFVIAPETWFRYRSATFGAGSFLIPWSTAGDSESFFVRMQLFTGTLYGCGRIAGTNSSLHFDLCGQTIAGGVRGEGGGFLINRQGARPWFGLGAMAMLEGPLLPSRLDWSLRLGGIVPLISQRFAGTRTQGTGAEAVEVPVVLFEPPKFAAFLSFGVRWTIL